jgi:DNA-binding CsgD family transcriptional regulator/tetratricopeptide (TPR) repeat protein
MDDTDDPQQVAGRQLGQLIIGREPELERIDAFLNTARTDGGALLITGEPGVGKTALLKAGSEAASAAGSRILRATGVEFEAGMSFAGLNQVVLPLLTDLRHLPAVHRDALNVALGFNDGAPPDRLVVSNAALMLLRLAATAQPLLVVIDDLPWLDRASAGVLSFVARRLEGSRVGLLGASRTGEVDFFERAGLPELEVQRLNDDASRRLLDIRFPDLAPSVRNRILAEAQGNPLALLELPAAVNARMQANSEALSSAGTSNRRLQRLFGSRIAELPPRTRQFLLRMALDGTGDVRVLEAGADQNPGIHALEAAEEARLVYMDEATHRLAFQHPLIRAAVVDLSLAEERRTAHRVLAEVWRDQPDRQAWHLAESAVGPDESVAVLLELSAARILARGDAVGCVKALTRSADLSPRDLERRRRLAAAAYIGAEVAGDLASASQMLTELRRGESEIEGSLQVALAAAAFLLNGDGDITTAHRLLVRAIENRIGASDETDPLLDEALNTLMMLCYYGGNADLWQPFHEITARIPRPNPVVQNSKTFADPVRTGLEAIGLLDSAIRDLGSQSDPTQIVRTGIAAVYVDRMGGCREALWRVVRDARQGGAVASGILALIILAYDDYWTGDWDEAYALIDEAIEVAENHGYTLAAWPAKNVQALVASARGDDQRTRELSAVVEWARPRGFGAVEWYAWHAQSLAALGRGDFEEAYQQVSKISSPGTLGSHVAHALAVLLDVVESALHTGRSREAAAHVAVMKEANLPALSSRLALICQASAAMVAPDEAAPEMFREALMIPGVERWQFDLARVRLAYGERLRRQRAMVDARVQLNAALAIFERLGARPWVGRTTSELRATGQTTPRASDSALNRLTPQELEIVRLAASGLTNKQIADRLYLSHRTVGGHLHRAFPKLGVATRSALRDALAAATIE